MKVYLLNERIRNLKSEIHIDDIGNHLDEWLGEFEMFSIYEIVPEILELWGSNLQTDVHSKKNLKKQVVR